VQREGFSDNGRRSAALESAQEALSFLQLVMAGRFEEGLKVGRRAHKHARSLVQWGEGQLIIDSSKEDDYNNIILIFV
jgi:hypothetical protein